MANNNFYINRSFLKSFVLETINATFLNITKLFCFLMDKVKISGSTNLKRKGRLKTLLSVFFE